MLRVGFRHRLSSTNLTSRLGGGMLGCASVSSFSSVCNISRRLQSSAGGGTETPPPSRATLEALARARALEAEQAGKAPEARTFQRAARGTDPAVVAQQMAKLEKEMAAGPADSASSSAAPPPPPPTSSGRTTARSTASPDDGAAQHDMTSAASSSSPPPVGSAASATGGVVAGPAGSTIMFDVPEGELPQQGSYDPWKVLGLKPGASAHDLRVRYHELLEQYHPDYVKDGGEGDVQRWSECDRAYQLVTKAPSHDKRFRNLMSDSQQFYYRVLPEWMSKNIDEMPRWWSWLRWKFPPLSFMLLGLFAAYGIGKMYTVYPLLAQLCAGALMLDILCHTVMFPVMFAVMLISMIFSGRVYDMAWLTSPKAFLRRPLQY